MAKKKTASSSQGSRINERSEKLNAIEAAMGHIQKDFGQGSIMRLGDNAVEDVEVISTGSIGLDNALGVGGFPRGRIVEIFGPESSGKTTLALHAIAEAQKQGGIAALIDAEHAFDRFYAENLVAALTHKAEIEGEMGDKNMGLQARLMSQAMRKLTGCVSRTRTTCIFINQLRDKIGIIFGSPETTTGGNALKFFASVRLDIRPTVTLKKNNEVVGRTVRVKVIKNKVAPPFRSAIFDIMFGEGISQEGEVVDLGVELGIVKKSGAWFSYDGRKIGQGRDAVKVYLSENPELFEEIKEKITEALESTHIVRSKAAVSQEGGEESDMPEPVDEAMAEDSDSAEDELELDEPPF